MANTFFGVTVKFVTRIFIISLHKTMGLGLMRLEIYKPLRLPVYRIEKPKIPNESRPSISYPNQQVNKNKPL